LNHKYPFCDLQTSISIMTGNSNEKLMMRRRPRKPLRRMVNVPPSAVAYKGPISIPVSDTTTVILTDNANLATGMSTAIISTVFNNNPSNARNWTEYSTAWNEYRVLGIRFTYDPLTPTPNGILLTGSGYQSIFHGTATAPTSLAEASSTGTARSFNVFKPFLREWRMVDINEATFVQTGSPSSTSDTLVVYSNNASPVNTTFGNVRIDYLVQFKTHVK